MTHFKLGDKVTLEGFNGCNVAKPGDVLTVTRVSNGVRVYFTRDDTNGSCSHGADNFTLINKGENNMSDVDIVTKLKNLKLSEADQALVEAGLIGADLEPTDAGQAVLISLLWDKHKYAITAKLEKIKEKEEQVNKVELTFSEDALRDADKEVNKDKQ